MIKEYFHYYTIASCQPPSKISAVRKMSYAIFLYKSLSQKLWDFGKLRNPFDFSFIRNDYNTVKTDLIRMRCRTINLNLIFYVPG